MSNSKEIWAYQCPECEEFYKYFNDAAECCAVIDNLTAYQCVVCNEIYEDEEDADTCCNEIDNQ